MNGPPQGAAWWAAWEPIVTLSAARLYGVALEADVLADCDPVDVTLVLIELVGRLLDSFGPAGAAGVVENWGAIVATRGAVHATRPDAERRTL